MPRGGEGAEEGGMVVRHGDEYDCGVLVACDKGDDDMQVAWEAWVEEEWDEESIWDEWEDDEIDEWEGEE
jgi:hypothetical protein